MKKLFNHVSLTVCLICIVNLLLSQGSPVAGCTTDAYLNQNVPNISFQQLLDKAWRSQQQAGQGQPPEQVYTIPTVVHIVHDNGPENISDARISQAISKINEAIRNQGVFSNNAGIDIEVELCMAQQDPQGDPTTGITRRRSVLSDMVMETEDAQLKALSFWDSENYLNIWIVGEVASIALGSGVTGYASFPAQHGTKLDGIVGEARFFSDDKEDITVFVHELGHYLGLYHTFEGGCRNQDCLTDGDRVCDTPPDASSAVVNCGMAPNSCDTDADDTDSRNPFRDPSLGGLGDQLDLISNYMDYSDLRCYEGFTQGQKQRMVFSLTNPRVSLLRSEGCLSLCTDPVSADFSIQNIPASYGDTVQLVPITTGTVQTYRWCLNGNIYSNAISPILLLNAIGPQIITLKVTGSDSLCQSTHVDTLEVTCKPSAMISGFRANILTGEQLVLTAMPANARSYSWFLNGRQIGFGSQYTFSSGFPGNANIQLVVDNGVCIDTSEMYFLRIGACGVPSYKHKMVWALEDSVLMDFNSNPASLSSNSKIHGRDPSNPTKSWLESSVSVSSEEGDLLFYSNGKIVWDRNHQAMPSGRGLLGSTSAQQAVIAFPDPASPSRYYLITQDAIENKFRNGVRYSIIDMQLNGGFGDIVSGEKNRLITVSNSENMGAVYHANGNDVWLLIRKNITTTTPPNPTDPSLLESYLITNRGLNPSPVITPLNSSGAFLGIFKISHDGSFFVEAGAAKNGPGLFDYTSYPSMLHRFDRSTGRIHFIMELLDNQYLNIPYGAEFSSDNTKIYLADLNQNLFQLDLSSGIPGTIRNSALNLTDGLNPGQLGKIELGPDRRIYLSQIEGDALHVIDKPNRQGLDCELMLQAISLPLENGSLKSWSLPSYIRGGRQAKISLVANTLVPCPGDTVKIYPEYSQSPYTLQYALAVPMNTFRRGDTLLIIPTQPGSFTVIGTYTDACGVSMDTLDINVKEGPFFDLGPSLMLCSNYLSISGPTYPQARYLWDDGTTNESRFVSSSGTYSLTITDPQTGCPFTDSILVEKIPRLPAPDLGPDVRTCPDAIHVLSLSQQYDQVRWQDGSQEPRYTVYTGGTYWVTVTDQCGRVYRDSVKVQQETPPALSLPDTLLICFEVGTEVDARIPGLARYQWADGTRDAVRLIEMGGKYALQAESDIGCPVFDTMVVEVNPPTPPIFITPLDTICEGDTLQVDVTTLGLEVYAWENGYIGSRRALTRDAQYMVTGYDIHGCPSEAELDLHVIIPPKMRLVREQFACGDPFVKLDVTTDGLMDYRWNDGYEGPERMADVTQRYTVESFDENGCVSRAFADVYMEYCPVWLNMPSAFTPNNDGINEEFGPIVGDHITAVAMEIYDRWGNMLFRGNSANDTWNGKKGGTSCPEGVYVYITYFTIDDGRRGQKKGTVTLLR